MTGDAVSEVFHFQAPFESASEEAPKWSYHAGEHGHHQRMQLHDESLSSLSAEESDCVSVAITKLGST